MGVTDHEHWMQQAIELARKARSLDEVPVGALVVLDGEAIGMGFNQPIAQSDPTAHAEIQALRAAATRIGNYRLSGASLFVTVEPCTMCAGAMIHARVSELIFGVREPRAGAVRSSARVLENPGINHRVEVTEGVLADECGTLISDFFKERRS